MTVQRTLQLVVTDTFTFKPSHLPSPPTELIGRTQEIKTLCNRLQGHSGRLLTLVGPPVIEAICQRLDCLPLAIELIAARSDLFSPQIMLARLKDRALDLLDDGPGDAAVGHRTLRNAIHRSYALCTSEEQRLLRALGVFVGGFDLAAVVHFGFTEAELQALVHKNLVKVEGQATGRFLLLETVRDYAHEQLITANELASVGEQHANYFFQTGKRCQATRWQCGNELV